MPATDPRAALLAPFLDAVCADPADMAVRLIMADRLTELGEDDRAEFIKAQVELSQPKYWTDAGRPRMRKGRRLRKREKELWKGNKELIQHPCQWFDIPNWACLADLGQTKICWTTENYDEIIATVRNGFVEEVSLSMQDWITHGPALVRVCPLRKVRITDKRPGGNHAGTKYGWFVYNSRCQGDIGRSIPFSVGQYLPGFRFERLGGRMWPWGWVWHKTIDDVNASLSDACLRHARNIWNEDRITRGQPPLPDFTPSKPVPQRVKSPSP